MSNKVFAVSVSVVLFILCIVTAVSILPERCILFSDNSGLQCDALIIPYVPCGCQDRRMASVATIIAGLGISSFFIPFFVYVIRSLLKRSNEETKLFD